MGNEIAKIQNIRCYFLLTIFISSTLLAQDNQKNISPKRDSSEQIIGFSTQNLYSKKPESLLGNFITDAVKNEAEIFLRKRIDVLFISDKAIRGFIPKGDVSEQMIKNILPFDDSLSYAEIDGATMLLLVEKIAQQGGAPIAGLQMKIKNMRPSFCMVDGDSLFPEKKYMLITIERNMQGKENFSFLKKIKYKNLPNTLTSTIIKYIKKITSEGKPINAYYGHRISYE